MCSRPRVIVSSKTSCVSRVVTVVARVGSCARVCMERALSPAAFFHVHFELQEKKRAGATAAPPAGKRVRQDCGTAEKKTQKCFGRGCNSKKGRTRQRRSSAKQSGKSQTDVQHLTLLGGALYAPTKRSGSGRRLREHDCREQLNGGCLRKLTRLKPAWGGGLRVPPPRLSPAYGPVAILLQVTSRVNALRVRRAVGVPQPDCAGEIPRSCGDSQNIFRGGVENKPHRMKRDERGEIGDARFGRCQKYHKSRSISGFRTDLENLNRTSL